jgi:hypothetical protein
MLNHEDDDSPEEKTPDEAPETPPDEPQPTPVQDPPAEPTQVPYVVGNPGSADKMRVPHHE